MYIVFFFVLDFTNGIPSYCHNYYSEFSLHEEYNKNIDPELNMTISEKSYLYNIVEVRINIGNSNYMNKTKHLSGVSGSTQIDNILLIGQ